jgi:hypothetical protein
MKAANDYRARVATWAAKMTARRSSYSKPPIEVDQEALKRVSESASATKKVAKDLKGKQRSVFVSRAGNS